MAGIILKPKWSSPKPSWPIGPTSPELGKPLFPYIQPSLIDIGSSLACIIRKKETSKALYCLIYTIDSSNGASSLLPTFHDAQEPYTVDVYVFFSVSFSLCWALVIRMMEAVQQKPNSSQLERISPALGVAVNRLSSGHLMTRFTDDIFASVIFVASTLHNCLRIKFFICLLYILSDRK